MAVVRIYFAIPAVQYEQARDALVTDNRQVHVDEGGQFGTTPPNDKVIVVSITHHLTRFAVRNLHKQVEEVIRNAGVTYDLLAVDRAPLRRQESDTWYVLRCPNSPEARRLNSFFQFGRRFRGVRHYLDRRISPILFGTGSMVLGVDKQQAHPRRRSLEAIRNEPPNFHTRLVQRKETDKQRDMESGLEWLKIVLATLIAITGVVVAAKLIGLTPLLFAVVLAGLGLGFGVIVQLRSWRTPRYVSWVLPLAITLGTFLTPWFGYATYAFYVDTLHIPPGLLTLSTAEQAAAGIAGISMWVLFVFATIGTCGLLQWGFGVYRFANLFIPFLVISFLLSTILFFGREAVAAAKTQPDGVPVAWYAIEPKLACFKPPSGSDVIPLYGPAFHSDVPHVLLSGSASSEWLVWTQDVGYWQLNASSVSVQPVDAGTTVC